MADQPLHWWSARSLAAAIRERTVSSAEVVAAFLDRIDTVNDRVNAIVSPVPRAEALAAAERADRAIAAGEAVGPIHGLPIAVKDLMDVAGLPTSHGTPTFAGGPPASTDSMLAERLRRGGAIFVGKTNTPEYGLGTLTFNEPFGVTRSPWDLSQNAGGSSGGAAAAVSAGMLPFADGSDSGGSLRYPAAFCNVIGLRVSPGRIASGRRGDAWAPHGVLGPIARTAADAGLLLSALAGPDPRAPLSLDDDPRQFADVVASRLEGLRIAWSPTGGGLPVEDAVSEVLASTLGQLTDAGAVVEEVDDALFDDADACWETIEMFGFLESTGEAVLADPGAFGPDLVRNVEQGRDLKAEQIAEAFAQRTEIFRRVERLFGDHDVLALPATPLAGVPAETRWPRAAAGVEFQRYFEWQRLACRVTVTAHPALSVPGGFTPGGLPVGLQLVGCHRGERELLGHAAAVEALTGLAERRPPL